jgi:membrane-bound serine protease (ClpP class)
LILGIIPFLISLRAKQPRTRWLLLGGALAAYMIGSAFLFTGPNGQPAVNFVLILILSAFNVGLVWLLMRKSLEAFDVRPTLDLDRLVGMQGTAISDLNPMGSVILNSENWTARSSSYIPAGSRVRVTSRHGLTLDVAPVQPDETTTQISG